MKIVNEINSPLLNRREIKIELDYSGAVPSKDSIKKKISENLKIDENLVIVKHVYPRYGENKADAIAYAYKSEDDIKKIEKKVKDGKEKVEEQKTQ